MTSRRTVLKIIGSLPFVRNFQKPEGSLPNKLMDWLKELREHKNNVIKKRRTVETTLERVEIGVPTDTMFGGSQVVSNISPAQQRHWEEMERRAKEFRRNWKQYEENDKCT